MTSLLIYAESRITELCYYSLLQLTGAIKNIIAAAFINVYENNAEVIQVI